MSSDPDAAASTDPKVVADRANGVLMGLACGDALGAGYEFEPPQPPHVPIDMVGGGPFDWAPGEWTDDTQMAIAILHAAEDALRARTHLLERLDLIAQQWTRWAETAKGVGNQTRAVLSGASAPTEAGLSQAARDHHTRTGRSGGNGSLMRTAPVALAYLDDEVTMAVAARSVSELTHVDPDAGDACVLWCAAIRHAVLTGNLDIHTGLTHLDPARRDTWLERITEAEDAEPVAFNSNGWVVHAFQAAWSAIHRTPVPEGDPRAHLPAALEAAVRAGNDTDTVAAIAGSLLGARWGAQAIPRRWRNMVHGWPGMDVVELGLRGLGITRLPYRRH